MKIAEMFAEAIPGVIIQLMAIATSDTKMLELQHGFQLQCQQLQQALPQQQLVMTGTQTLLREKNTPDFYGYIPAKASKRTVVFVSMLLLSAGMLLIRCTTIVLLGLMGGSWAFLYIGVDLGLYIVG